MIVICTSPCTNTRYQYKSGSKIFIIISAQMLLVHSKAGEFLQKKTSMPELPAILAAQMTLLTLFTRRILDVHRFSGICKRTQLLGSVALTSLLPHQEPNFLRYQPRKKASQPMLMKAPPCTRCDWLRPTSPRGKRWLRLGPGNLTLDFQKTSFRGSSDTVFQVRALPSY